MKTVSSYTTISNHFTGSIAQSDLAKHGKIDLRFYIHANRIGVDVAGFSYCSYFLLNAKNESQKKQNSRFIERYVKPCYNSEELLNTIFK